MKHRLLSSLNLRNLNHVLSLCIVSLALYVIAIPFLPQVTFTIKDNLGITTPLVKAGSNADKTKYPTVNTLVVPSLNLQQQIHEGTSEAVLTQGLWHRPHTSSPDKNSNTVIAGHRFTYSDPAVFYHLDKIKPGDEIIVYWNMKKYVYKTTVTKEVSPNDLGIEKPTKDPILTLYTCTPLWTSKNRLVVQANLIGVDQ